MALHSAQLLDHFQNPRNVGHLPPPAVTVDVSNPACGDMLRLSARLEDQRVTGVAYQVRGCTASIAAGSALTEWMRNKSVAELSAFTGDIIEDALGGLQPASKHVAALCADGIRRLCASLPK